MNKEPQDIEELLNALLPNFKSAEEKSIIESYFRNREALTPEYRERAAETVSKYLFQFPELANFQPKKRDSYLLRGAGKILGGILDFTGCALEALIESVKEHAPIYAGTLAAGLLTAAGIYTGSYLAAAELGIGVGIAAPFVTNFLVPYGDRADEGGKVVITSCATGGSLGLIAGCFAYGVLPDIASGETANLLAKSVLGGIGAGIIGTIVLLSQHYESEA